MSELARKMQEQGQGGLEETLGALIRTLAVLDRLGRGVEEYGRLPQECRLTSAEDACISKVLTLGRFTLKLDADELERVQERLRTLEKYGALAPELHKIVLVWQAEIAAAVAWRAAVVQALDGYLTTMATET